MKRKTSELPTRIYNYGCLAPTAGADVVDEQLRLRTRYQNKLVEIERRKHEEQNRMTLAWSDELNGALTHATEQTLAAEEQYMAERSRTGDKSPASTALRVFMRARRAEVLAEARRLIEAARGEQPVRDLEAMQATVDRYDAAMKAARVAIKAARAGAGVRAETAPQVAHYREMRRCHEEARRLLNAERARLKSPALQCVKRAIGDVAGAEIRAARAVCGLYSATYLKAEESIKQAVQQAWTTAKKERTPFEPPRFRRHDGSGAVVVQLVGGITVAEAMSGEDTRLRIFRERSTPRVFSDAARAASPAMGAQDMRAEEERLNSPPARWGVRKYASEEERAAAWRARPEVERLGSSGRHARRRAAADARVMIRVGSNADQTPVWAEFPMIFHRPLPADGVIKWAWVLRRKVGLHFEYRFQVTLESAEFIPPAQPCGQGTVAIDIGWRNLRTAMGEAYNGEVRVAYLVDDQGREEEIRVPSKVLLGLDKVDDLRSIRDKNFNIARAALLTWLGEVHTETRCVTAVEPWNALALAVRLRNLVQWRAIAKLAAFVNAWERNRFAGDEQIFTTLSTWAKQDRHLLSWEANQRDRRINHRREFYRLVGVRLARTYANIVLEEFDLTKPEVNELKPVEESVPSDGRQQRSTKRVAAPGELRDSILKAAVKYGARVSKVDAAYTTQKCAECGFCPEEPWDASVEITHRCESCGAVWDQDANACRNLLALASAPVTPEEGGPLATDNAAETQTDTTAEESLSDRAAE